MQRVVTEYSKWRGERQNEGECDRQSAKLLLGSS